MDTYTLYLDTFLPKNGSNCWSQSLTYQAKLEQKVPVPSCTFASLMAGEYKGVSHRVAWQTLTAMHLCRRVLQCQWLFNTIPDSPEVPLFGY